jgi:glycosyltransferase involved in cell wall biosynthesis
MRQFGDEHNRMRYRVPGLVPLEEVKSKILVLTTSYPSDDNDPSGVFIAKLLGAIQRRGYSIKVVAPSNGVFHGTRRMGEVETVRFGYFWPRSLEKLTAGGGGIPENMANSLLAKLQVFPMMLAFVFVTLRELRGRDVIYANWLGAGIVGAVANFLTGKPLVVSFRGDDGYLARDRMPWRILTRWVTKRARLIAPVSAELLSIIRDLGVPDTKCHLPRFGVDTDMFHPATCPVPEAGEIRLLFVGSLIDRKGLHDLLEALADPALNSVRLIVVGEGPNAGKLAEMADSLGLSRRIDWKGIVAPVEVARIMRSCHMLCLPSYMEGRPNVVNEAMASALTVIVTRIGGVPDMVEEGRTALLFEPGDIEGLRQCLKTLVQDPGLRRDMGRAGHEFLIRSGVSWDATAEEFDALFCRVSGSRSP